MDTRMLEKQFVDFVTEHKQIIYKVCYIYATDNDNLNDLYQETVINLWKSFPCFRGECKASTWVYRIALNTCISFFRKSNSRPTVIPITVDMESDFADEEEKTSQLRELYHMITGQIGTRADFALARRTESSGNCRYIGYLQK